MSLFFDIVVGWMNVMVLIGGELRYLVYRTLVNRCLDWDISTPFVGVYSN